MENTDSETSFNPNEYGDGFEEPSYGGGGFENRGLKPDSVELYRLYPAMKSLKKKREYLEYWATHFWLGRDPKNPEKTKLFPILCPQERDFTRNGIITKECPLCKKRETVKQKVKAIEGRGAEKNATKAQIAKATQPYNLWLRNHGHDGKYRTYAMDRAGNYVVLRITPTCSKLLRAEVKKLVQAKHRPLSLEKGVWFEFTRTGKGLGVKDSVSTYRQEREDGSSVIEFHTISPQQARTALDVFPDFDEEKKRITYSDAQLQELAELADDNVDDVPRILGIATNEENDVDLSGDSEPNLDGSSEPAVSLDDDFGSAAVDHSGEDATVDNSEVIARAQAIVAAAAKKAAKPLAEPVAAPKTAQAAPATQSQAKPAAAAAKASPAKPAGTPPPPAAALDPMTASDAEFDDIFSSK
jgi:hypothetical protein